MKKNRYLIVIAVALAALTLGACTSSSADLQGTEWQWVKLNDSNLPAQSSKPDAESYTITFTDGEIVSIKADCNLVLGSYSASRSRLTIEAGSTTLAYCGEESQDVIFLDLIAQVVSYELVEETLRLGLEHEAGSLEFIKVGTN